jgi:hypothetical protein
MRKMVLASFALIVAAIAPAPGSGRLARAQAVGGSSKASAAPVALDACALLTPQEAAAGLGEAVKPKATRTIVSTLGPGIDTAVSGCTYKGATKDLTLGVRHTTDAAAGRLRQMVQMICRGKEAAAGLGDVACWYSPAHQELQALKRATFLTVELRGGGDAAEAIKRVAVKALARVP